MAWDCDDGERKSCLAAEALFLSNVAFSNEQDLASQP
jgi:hypothetical protein